ncbi:MAG: hypothetical protein FJ240_04045 [Nitrospira sp.]|nr:hypothetical protein [Nitrospira sp.]
MFRADRYGVENPAQRQKARRIKYGVPGTPELTSKTRPKDKRQGELSMVSPELRNSRTLSATDQEHPTCEVDEKITNIFSF